MEKSLNIIWRIAITFAILSTIVGFFVDFSLIISQLFVAVMFLIIGIDSYIMMKKNTNPFNKNHYRFNGFLSFLTMFILITIAFTKENMILNMIFFIIFVVIAFILIKHLSLYSKLIPYIVRYEELEQYADKMREYYKNQEQK